MTSAASLHAAPARTGDRLDDWPAEHGLTITWVTARDGTRLRVMRGGRAGAPRLVCLHGFPQNAACWRKLLPLVRDRFSFLAYDLRGFGKSDPAGSDGYALETLAGDLEAVLEQTRDLGAPGPATVCAHDWGGPIAWRLVSDRPDLVGHHVSVNAPHFAAYLRALRDDGKQRKGSWYTALFQIPGIEHVLAANGAAAFVRTLRASSRPGTFTDEDLELYLGPFRDPARLRTALCYYRAGFAKLRQGRPAFEAPVVTVPTTIVWGERDPALRPVIVDITVREYCPRAHVVRLPGASHWVPDEQPEAIASAILAGPATPGRTSGGNNAR